MERGNFIRLLETAESLATEAVSIQQRKLRCFPLIDTTIIPAIAEEKTVSLEEIKTLVRSAKHKAAYVPRPDFGGDEKQGKGWERSLNAQFSRIPAHLQPVTNEGIWWANVRRSDIMNRRRDFAQNIEKICKVLVNFHRRTSKTIAATWQAIAEAAKVSESTVNRTLALLRENGFIATIASGKSANKNTPQNWAPVYVLTMPRIIVSKSSEYPSNDYFSNHSQEAREQKKLTYSERNRRRFAQKYREFNRDLGSKSQKPADAPAAELQEALEKAALCLQLHSLDLRGLPTHEIIKETHKAFISGWTVGDILHALESRPTGEIWNTSGAGGMKYVQSWLRLRLKAWESEEGYLPSKSQKTAQKLAQHRAQMKKQAEELKQEQAKKAVRPPSSVKEFMKMLRQKGRKAALKAFPQFAD